MKLRTVTALLVATGVALGGTAAADAAPKKSKRVASQKVLKRALAASVNDTSILHLRTRTTSSGIGTFTDDVWMHVGAAGFVDAVRELRVDGTYAGDESVLSQPNGLGNPRGAIGRTRDSASAPIRTMEGVGYGDSSIGGVIDTALDAARGELDLSQCPQRHLRRPRRVRDPPARGVGHARPAQPRADLGHALDRPLEQRPVRRALGRGSRAVAHRRARRPSSSSPTTPPTSRC